MGKPLLTWDEIRANAIAFSKEWERECSEIADSQTFLEEFFKDIFGIPRKSVATYEKFAERFHKTNPRSHGRIDLFWPKLLLVEMKSTGKNLDDAFDQALNYTLSLSHEEAPAYILVSDFANFRLYDLEKARLYEFSLKHLHKHVHRFAFMTGRKNAPEIEPLNPINQKAALALGKLHEQIKASGYAGHNLEVLLVRLLFCLFAQCSRIFDHGAFTQFIQNTREDGHYTGSRLVDLFEVLDTEENLRQQTLNDELASFRYINGDLFKEKIPTVHFNREMRQSLLDCCKLDWSEISPAIFGTLFQSIMNDESRRAQGAHYTSEENILKLINPLFMDELREEFEKVKKNKQQLAAYHDKLRSLTFFDPACGCGNFLVIAYRELRLLELNVIRIKDKSAHLKRDIQLSLDIRLEISVDVDQFYGIELEEWPAQIAQVALWLTDHQMNLKAEQELGQRFDRIPLKTSPHILHRNALTTKWEELAPHCSYILGNPPFIGFSNMDSEQKLGATQVLEKIRLGGSLDYVCCWFVKAAHYMQIFPTTRTAFVSTNSISQGEQVGILWEYLLKLNLHINFAHRTFQWNNEAKGKAAVHCVIIGFSTQALDDPKIFEYSTPTSEPTVIHVSHISPYLIDGDDTLLKKRNKPISPVPKMKYGNKPTDGQHLQITPEMRSELINEDTRLEQFIRRYIGAKEFISNKLRYCLWLKDAPPEISRIPTIKKCLEQVRQSRLNSTKSQTRKLAATPALFEFTSHTEAPYLLIPRHSSEQRNYIPMGFMTPNVIASDACLVIPNATLYHFGVLSSSMHMAWVRTVCGRIKSDFRYSSEIVYNNFPWPNGEKNKKTIANAAQYVLDVRQKYASNSLEDLYDPLAMPQDLLAAHTTLNREVDKAYGLRRAQTDAERISFLFNLYSENR